MRSYSSSQHKNKIKFVLDREFNTAVITSCQAVDFSTNNMRMSQLNLLEVDFHDRN